TVLWRHPLARLSEHDSIIFHYTDSSSIIVEKQNNRRKDMLKSSVKAAVSALCLGLFTCVGFVAQADAAAKCIKGDRKAPYTLGWANVYSVPTCMKQTEGTIAAEVEELKSNGLVDKLVITDAQGDANVQIQQ